MKLGLNFLKEMTTQQLSNLSKDDLIDLVARGSKNLAQSLRRLKKSNTAKYSAYLSRHGGRIDVKEYKASTLKKMRKTRLENLAIKLGYKARAKTVSVKGTKEFSKKYKEATGNDYADFLKKNIDWSKVRTAMELFYGSEEILEYYDDALTAQELADEARHAYEEDSFELVKKELDEKKELYESGRNTIFKKMGF